MKRSLSCPFSPRFCLWCSTLLVACIIFLWPSKRTTRPVFFLIPSWFPQSLQIPYFLSQLLFPCLLPTGLLVPWRSFVPIPEALFKVVHLVHNRAEGLSLCSMLHFRPEPKTAERSMSRACQVDSSFIIGHLDLFLEPTSRGALHCIARRSGAMWCLGPESSTIAPRTPCIVVLDVYVWGDKSTEFEFVCSNCGSEGLHCGGDRER